MIFEDHMKQLLHRMRSCGEGLASYGVAMGPHWAAIPRSSNLIRPHGAAMRSSDVAMGCRDGTAIGPHGAVMRPYGTAIGFHGGAMCSYEIAMASYGPAMRQSSGPVETDGAGIESHATAMGSYGKAVAPYGFARRS